LALFDSLKNNYSLTGGGRWPTSIAYARVGGERAPYGATSTVGLLHTVLSSYCTGRVFDVEVDVLDTACYDVLHAINKCAAKEYEVDDRVRTVSLCSRGTTDVVRSAIRAVD
jgi:hypothetical protein